MSESACLLRSFSHPSDASREAKEGDPMRALGESISFGRFMSDSLAWEKWSAFSHNRYLEEVEKFSKPGSVAQKKAYFEAHYKKKAAEKAAALLEEANTAATNEVKTEEQSCTSSCPDSEMLRADNQVIATSERQDFVDNREFVSSTDADAHHSTIEESTMEIVKVEEERNTAATTEVKTEEQSCTCSCPDSEMLRADNQVIATCERQDFVDNREFVSSTDADAHHSTIEESTMEIVKVEEERNTAATTEVKTEEQSCTSSCPDSEMLRADNQVIATIERQDFVDNREFVSSTDADAHHSTVEESTMEIVKVEEEIVDQNVYMETSANIENVDRCKIVEDHTTIVVPVNEEISADLSPAPERQDTASGTPKRQRKNPSKLLTHSRSSKPPSSPAKQTTSIQQPIHRSNVTPKSKRRAGDIAERLTTKSVSMSINSKFHPQQIGKTSPELQQHGGKRTYTIPVVESKENSTLANRVQASVNGLLKQSLKKLPSENRRCLSSSTENGSKERSPIVCSPFRFRSEERAAKRKEFFQKLEEKANMGKRQQQERYQEGLENNVINVRGSIRFKAKADQNVNQGSKSPNNHIKKERPENDITNVRQSRSFKAKENQDSNLGSNQGIKKVPITRAQSPKLGRKPATSMVQDTSSLPPRRPSVTSDSSKCVNRKKYQGTDQSITSRWKKMVTYENSSPNIQD